MDQGTFQSTIIDQIKEDATQSQIREVAVAALSSMDDRGKSQALKESGFGGPVGERAINRIWYIIVGTVAAVALGGLIAVVWLITEEKPVDVVVAIVTTALGGTIGLMSNSPNQTKT